MSEIGKKKKRKSKKSGGICPTCLIIGGSIIALYWYYYIRSSTPAPIQPLPTPSQNPSTIPDGAQVKLPPINKVIIPISATTPKGGGTKIPSVLNGCI